MTAVFISDLHLDASRPAATASFLRFLEDQLASGDELYILGDLFEAWIGDDGGTEHDRAVISGLRRLRERGIRARFMRGNRDFLVAGGFAREAAVELLEDEAVVGLDGQRVLLMHGDSLCTDDHAYQRYRRLVRNPGLQALYLALPLGLRRAVARSTRQRSTAANATKAPAIMDVNPEAVSAALRRHGVATLIHGHTHRPCIHRPVLDGRPATRIVLGDWYDQGSYLRWTPERLELSSLPFR